VERALYEWLQMKEPNIYHGGKLMQRWDQCIMFGDFLEKC